MDSNTLSLTLSARGDPLALSARSGPLALSARGGLLTLEGLRNRYKIPRDRANMMFVMKRVFLVTSLAVMTAASVNGSVASVTVYAKKIKGFNIATGRDGLTLDKVGKTTYRWTEGTGDSLPGNIQSVELSFMNGEAYLDFFSSRFGNYRATKEACSNMQRLQEDYAAHYVRYKELVRESPRWTIMPKKGRTKKVAHHGHYQEAKPVNIRLKFTSEKVEPSPEEGSAVSANGGGVHSTPAATDGDVMEGLWAATVADPSANGGGAHSTPAADSDGGDSQKSSQAVSSRRRLMQRLLESEEALSQ